MRLEDRIKRLEAMLGEDKVSWKTHSGETVECYPQELFSLGMDEDSSPLLSKVLDADLSTYSGGGSLLGLVQAFVRSVEEYRE